MGFFRLLLTALVVLSHFGGLPWFAGRVAVFAFCCISGFLVFRVLDRVYLNDAHGPLRFYANRIVRLGPLFVAWSVITLTLSLVDDWLAKALQDAGVGIAGASPGELLWQTLTLAPTLTHDQLLPILGFSPPLVPQGWSIGVQAVCYLFAPFVVLATRRRPAWLLLWIVSSLLLVTYGFQLAGVDFERFETHVYKNAVGTATMFLIGGGLYYVRRRVGGFVGTPVVAAAVVAWVAYLTVPVLHAGSFPLPGASTFAQALWLTLVVTTLVIFHTPTTTGQFQRVAGQMCYGVYLCHVLIAAIVIPWLPVGVNDRGLIAGTLVLIASLLVAAASYALVERPLERLRARVRGVPVLPDAFVVPRLQPAWIVAGVLLTAALARPATWSVERINGTDTSAGLPVSHPFDIRWKPEVTTAMRRKVESAFGLQVVGEVARDPRHRTYQYRLPTPTRARVRALLTQPEVEDTARIDIRRSEIAQ